MLVLSANPKALIDKPCPKSFDDFLRGLQHLSQDCTHSSKTSMVTKRSIDALDEITSRRTTIRDRKRSRVTSSDIRSDSSVLSSGSVSEASAMKSTPPREHRAEQSSVSSAPSREQDESEESASSVSSSSSDESSSGQEEGDSENEQIITLGGPKKPKINPSFLSNAQDLQARLKSFLPQLQQANSELAAKGTGLGMEDVEDGEEHIEMNLGLGVLETKDPGTAPGEVVLPQQAQKEDNAQGKEEQEADPIMIHLKSMRQGLGNKGVEVVDDDQTPVREEPPS